MVLSDMGCKLMKKRGKMGGGAKSINKKGGKTGRFQDGSG
jgi:hypothetical protein